MKAIASRSLQPGPRTNGSSVLGLVRSEDHGDTWTPVSGLGEVDWHVLERSRGLIAGVLFVLPGIVSAALLNGLEVTGKDMADLRVVVSGAGAAGIASFDWFGMKLNNVPLYAHIDSPDAYAGGSPPHRRATPLSRNSRPGSWRSSPTTRFPTTCASR